jgi:glutathione S-transferase
MLFPFAGFALARASTRAFVTASASPAATYLLARACAVAARDVFVPAPDGSAPRFVLFHAPFSMCSEKVRTLLAETGMSYVSHPLDVKDGYSQNYHPDYVALRIEAWRQMGEPPFAGEAGYKWTGSSSVQATGFDACVVPTLVDVSAPAPADGALGAAAGAVPGTPRVLVDSKLICKYLADLAHTPLRPAEGEPGRALVDKHVALVDDTPHVALLYDGIPGRDRRPLYLRLAVGQGSGQAKMIEALERRLSEAGQTYAADSLVRRAYEAKLAKTRASQRVSVGEASYSEDVVSRVQAVLDTLEADLATSGGPWLLGEQISLADLFHAVSLHRLQWLGNAWLWEDGAHPHVTAFFKRSLARRGLQEAVLLYPSMMPSRHVVPLVRAHGSALAALRTLGKGLAMDALVGLTAVLPGAKAKPGPEAN